MPEIGEQMAIAESRTTDLVVARALLRRGRPYEDAVRSFAPYDRVQEVNEPVRRALRDLVEMARVDGLPAFIFVNNRLEGDSPAPSWRSRTNPERRRGSGSSGCRP